MTTAQGACARGAKTVASSPLVIRTGGMSVTTKRRLFPEAAAHFVLAGRVDLRFSPKCQSEWAVLVLASHFSSRGRVYVSATRLTDGAETAFGLRRVQPVFSGMLTTHYGCIQAHGSIWLMDGIQATATTPCMQAPAAPSRAA